MFFLRFFSGMVLLSFSCCKRVIIFCIRIFGVDAFVVTSTYLIFFIYFFWMFFVSLIKNARLFIRWVSFVRRLELEEFFESIINIIFVCFVRARIVF